MAPLIRKYSVFMMLALASAVAQKTPDPPPEPIPIPQMAPEELPAKAPRVSYHDGLLMIDANNASLADVLAAVAKETGAQIEDPSNAASERVAAHLSGAPRRVIAELLDGAKFGYIILSPLQDPAGIERVIVTRESQSETRPGAMAPPSRRPTMPQVEPGPTPDYSRADGVDRDSEPAAAAPAETSQPQPPEMQKSSSDGPVRPFFNGSDAQKSADPAQNPGPAMMQQGKSPTEVLQDLYRMRQQQVQQQNQSQQPNQPQKSQ